MIEILYADDRVLVCVKPAGVLSTDEPGGLPGLLRQQLNDPAAVVRTVHRLDRAVSGLMVLARTTRAAADLSAQIRTGVFEKEYMAVVHGMPEEQGSFTDLLYRDKVRRMTLVVDAEGEGVQQASLSYCCLKRTEGKSLVRIRLNTGRTHQIRVQFSSRGYPLLGDKKYGKGEPCAIGLWSCRIAFYHPRTGQRMEFEKLPPDEKPWL